MPMPRSDDAPILDVGTPEVLVDLPCETGEGPLWHDDEQALYWLDIPPGRVYRYDPATGTNELAYEHDGAVGGFTIQEDGALLLFCAADRVLRWHDGDVTTIINEVVDLRHTRFNDVIADPAGRVYCGTMPGENRRAALYWLDRDGSLTLLFDDIGLSNGMGFTADGKTMFHTDTDFRTIYRLEYDQATGQLSDRQPLVRTPAENGAPDGMAVDAEGTIWSARWGGWGLFRYNANGELLGSVPMPAANISSITFGGPDYGTAFVTTATAGQPRGSDIGELAGSLFSIDLGVRGRPPFRSRLGI